MNKFYVVKHLQSDLYLEDVLYLEDDRVDNWAHELIDVIAFSNEDIAWDYIRTVFGSDVAEENLGVVSISRRAIVLKATAEVFGQSVKDVLLQAAATFELINTADDCDYYGYYGDLEKVCCQPGCENQWVYLKHPVEAFDKDGFQLCRNYSDGTAPGSWLDVRGFCEKHHRRGGAGLDDADINYKLVMVRI